MGLEKNLEKANALYQLGSELGDVQCKLEYVKSHLYDKLEDKQVMVKLNETLKMILIS
jgi:hypothetical protein